MVFGIVTPVTAFFISQADRVKREKAEADKAKADAEMRTMQNELAEFKVCYACAHFENLCVACALATLISVCVLLTCAFRKFVFCARAYV